MYVCMHETLFSWKALFSSLLAKIYTCIFAPATHIMSAYLDFCDSDEFIVWENYVVETYKY